MSDKMHPLSFEKLMRWALKGGGQSVFGVKALPVTPAGRLELFSCPLEMPFGPAAGPHTQLAQNIVAAYAAGARFFELKTVQTLDGDDLPVDKPCILAQDECYNVEWSTELTVQAAMEEYIKAYLAIKLLAREYGWGDPEAFIFNMSLGYDYQGITSKKLDDFIEGLVDASKTEVWRRSLGWALENAGLFQRVDEAYLNGIAPQVCASATLSTLHGCPASEIEKIAAYLLCQKGLHTFVKCNPTLLGYEFARDTLDSLGFGYVSFDRHHFLEDLQYSAAVPMFGRLRALAEQKGLEFGLKLTNTFPVEIKNNELAGGEMYMSGRALFPLTAALAARLARDVEGTRLSFSGGADAFNAKALFEAGAWPITMATTLLKPGGYNRFNQLASLFEGQAYPPFNGAKADALEAIAAQALTSPFNTKGTKPLPSRKLDKKVPLLDCFTAPCKGGCPIGQDIPEYIYLCGQQKYRQALEVITQTNPLPFITGTICPHRCSDKCTRNHYETPVTIRGAKLECAQMGYEDLMDRAAPSPKSGARAAVIGGGPGGLSAAYFLARQGVEVTLYERKKALGGVVRHVIPDFRIEKSAVEKDVRLVEAQGIRVLLGQEAPPLEALRAQYGHVVIATGAWGKGALALEEGDAVDALAFLQAFKAGEAQELGKVVAVIGGGNTAMDVARAAKRVAGVERVMLVYRRTRAYMPAGEEELDMARAQGVEFMELLSPLSHGNGRLLCRQMALGPFEKGRRSVAPTEGRVELEADTVIAAVGSGIESEWFEANGIAVEKGRPVTAGLEEKGVYVVGDARRGPATVVEAIADGQRAAAAIAGWSPAPAPQPEGDPRCKKGTLALPRFASDSDRCLECGSLCENCVDVCPNRANVAVDGQIVHLEALCNECGNCHTFCPYDSAPYREKLTLFADEGELENSSNIGFAPLDGEKVLVRREEGGKAQLVDLGGPNGLDGALARLMARTLDEYGFLLGR